ncbi:hypothetical protein SXCC_02081 [Gluconacetobacter sp. SXCC-1]|nr:hypothetical protein SXCC_02081 [Gluconacetobacter sp. SXCC-1]
MRRKKVALETFRWSPLRFPDQPGPVRLHQGAATAVWRLPASLNG